MCYFQKTPITCPGCGKTFVPKRRKQKTCGSDECEKLWRKMKAQPKQIAPRHCIICERKFIPKSSKQITCGHAACQRRRMYERQLEHEAEIAEAYKRRSEASRKTWITRKLNARAGEEMAA